MKIVGGSRLFALLLAASLLALPVSARSEPAPSPAPSPIPSGAPSRTMGEATVCEGVYSTEQAQSGQKIFAANCAQCHGANFRGGFGVASLSGAAFTTLWGDKTLLSLFDKMKSTMPLASPGSLSDQSYLEVLARILEVNAFPASSGLELPLQREQLERLALPKKCP